MDPTDSVTDPEGAALLAAVRARPDDDTVRLVYADWLDEYGGPVGAARAALIRAHVGTAVRVRDLGARAVASERPGLCALAAAAYPGTFVPVAAAARAPVTVLSDEEPGHLVLTCPQTGGPTIVFDRGFLHTVSAPWSVLAEFGDAIAAECAGGPPLTFEVSGAVPLDGIATYRTRDRYGVFGYLNEASLEAGHAVVVEVAGRYVTVPVGGRSMRAVETWPDGTDHRTRPWLVALMGLRWPGVVCRCP